MKRRVLLIDDTRDETAPNIMMRVDLIARNYWAGRQALRELGPWDLLLLDHDLNSYDESGKEFTGYDIVCFLEYSINSRPKDIKLVTSNPVGRSRMEVVLKKLYPNVKVF